VLALIGLLVLSSTHGGPSGPILLIGGVGLLGFGNGAKRGMNTYFFTRFYGLKSLAEMAGLSIAISSLVLAPAPFVFGLIYDRTHSYNGALWILGGGLVIANLLYLFVGPYRFAANIGAATPVEVLNPIAEGAPA
jgi:cyanate permease